MDNRGQRPPRSARPPGPQTPAPPYQSQAAFTPGRTPLPEYPSEPQRGISFQNTERGDRQAPLDQTRLRQYSAYQPQSPPLDGGYAEAGGAPVGRKKSLVRPDREKIDPGHRQYHYHTRVAELQEEGGNINSIPSSASSDRFVRADSHMRSPHSYGQHAWTAPGQVSPGQGRRPTRVWTGAVQARHPSPQESCCTGRYSAPVRRVFGQHRAWSQGRLVHLLLHHHLLGPAPFVESMR